MFVEPYYREDDQEYQVKLMKTYPLGTLTTYSEEGGLRANHIPFLVDQDESGKVVRLRGHVARRNPQLPDLKSGKECMIVFQGPEDYVSPSWYATKKRTGKMVPTWNFTTVHIYGTPRVVIDEPEWLRKQLDDLTDVHEHSRAEPWKVDDAPEAYTTLLQKAIYGLEITVTRLEAKTKMSQNLIPDDINGVIDGFKEQGGESGQTMSNLVRDTAIRNKKISATD